MKEKRTLQEYKKAVFQFIDDFPDVVVFSVILVSSALQVVIGTSLRVILFSFSFMLFSLFPLVSTNLLLKNILKIKRPQSFILFRESIFSGSFPSLHSQFAAGESTTHVTVIALYVTKTLRLFATGVAVLINGVASFVVAWSRVVLRKHYPKDAIGGFMLGVLIGFLVPYYVSPYLWNIIPLIWQVISLSVFYILVSTFTRIKREADVERSTAKK